jgi:hypothetical protein
MTSDTNANSPSPKKKKPIVKWTLRILASLALLIVIAFLLYYFMIDGYIRSKVIEAAKNATGQDTKLELADLRAFGGTLTLSKFNLANPKDFSPGGVVDFSSCVVSVDTGSLMTDTVVVKEIVISDMVVSIEQKDLRNNLAEIINYVQSQRGEPTEGQAATPQTAANPNAGKSKELKINTVRIVHPTIKIDLLGVKNTFTLSDIKFDEPTNPEGRNPKLIDLIARILLEMSGQALNAKEMPDAIKNSLGKFQGAINKELSKGIDKATQEIDKVNKEIQKGMQNIGKDITLPGNIKPPEIKLPEIKNPFEQKK